MIVLAIPLTRGHPSNKARFLIPKGGLIGGGGGLFSIGKTVNLEWVFGMSINNRLYNFSPELCNIFIILLLYLYPALEDQGVTMKHLWLNKIKKLKKN